MVFIGWYCLLANPLASLSWQPCSVGFCLPPTKRSAVKAIFCRRSLAHCTSLTPSRVLVNISVRRHLTWCFFRCGCLLCRRKTSYLDLSNVIAGKVNLGRRHARGKTMFCHFSSLRRLESPFFPLSSPSSMSLLLIRLKLTCLLAAQPLPLPLLRFWTRSLFKCASLYSQIWVLVCTCASAARLTDDLWQDCGVSPLVWDRWGSRMPLFCALFIYFHHSEIFPPAASLLWPATIARGLPLIDWLPRLWKNSKRPLLTRTGALWHGDILSVIRHLVG